MLKDSLWKWKVSVNPRIHRLPYPAHAACRGSTHLSTSDYCAHASLRTSPAASFSSHHGFTQKKKQDTENYYFTADLNEDKIRLQKYTRKETNKQNHDKKLPQVK